MVRERLDLDMTLSSRTNLSKANMILVKFVVDNCFFQYINKVIFGCPMGSPISALLHEQRTQLLSKQSQMKQ